MTRAALVVAVLMTACSGGSTPEVSDAWTPPMPPSAPSIALYVSVRGGDGDRLVGVAAPSCRAVELHDTSLEEGVMRMRPVELPMEVEDGIDMNPAGMHVMCIDPVASPQVGETVPVVLSFEQAGDVEADVVVETR